LERLISELKYRKAVKELKEAEQGLSGPGLMPPPLSYPSARCDDGRSSVFERLDGRHRQVQFAESRASTPPRTSSSRSRSRSELRQGKRDLSARARTPERRPDSDRSRRRHRDHRRN
jgi:hypothetical protein